jgi:hypothetical protein
MFMCNTAVRDFCEKNATPILATIAGVAIGLQLASSKGKTKSLLDVNNMTPITTSIAQTVNSTIYMVNDATILFRDIPHPLVMRWHTRIVMLLLL